ncbi:hypothetical protein [Nocardia farcinica]|uniref:hypothetical protein n=1 Tax=Nocardia farcinica TaxID=37329 RepID=UPI00245377D4|nr:hypothetical protein [Nocardia farcinica]
MAAVSQLSYVVGTSSDVSAWKQYATEVLGLEVSRDSSDSLLYIRADDRHHRLGVRAGHDDDVAYVGWDVASKSALDAAAARLDAAGVAVTAGSAAGAAGRGVLELV